MLARTFKYTDYDGNEREETHFFNLTEAEIMEMEMSTSGGLAEMMKRIVAAKDAPAIIKTFKEIIAKAYGVKSPDGKRMMKIDPVDGHRYASDFEETPAYSELFMELSTDADKAAAFVNAICPKPKQEIKPAKK